MMISRNLTKAINDACTQYPVIAIMGPRQSGKSTLVQSLFPNKTYVNLESIDDRKLIATDPKSFLDSIPENGVVIDEVQKLPDLLSYIQVYVDKEATVINNESNPQKQKKSQKAHNGKFILTGSHQLELQESITQSLAGRVSLLKLLPLSIREIKNNMSAEDYIIKGLFPKLYMQETNAYNYYQNYVSTYIERDVRKIINVKDLSLFQNFLFLLAGRIGQIINFTNVGNELGISNHTIKQWLSVLEASFIIFKLQPYFENIGKRVVKSPKIYFIDPGLACYLLGIENLKQLSRDPLRGQLFENLVILELLKSRYNNGKPHNLYFYRDNHQHEVDVIFKHGNQLIPIEIKSSKTFNLNFIKEIKYLDSFIADRIEHGWVIYSGEEKHPIGKYKVINFINSYKAIAT